MPTSERDNDSSTLIVKIRQWWQDFKLLALAITNKSTFYKDWLTRNIGPNIYLCKLKSSHGIIPRADFCEAMYSS